MKDNSMEIKYYTSIFCDAMARNINDNFLSVSFDISRGIITLKIILEKQTVKEDEYIEDIMSEFVAPQEFVLINPPHVVVGAQHATLPHLVYRKNVSA